MTCRFSRCRFDCEACPLDPDPETQAHPAPAPARADHHNPEGEATAMVDKISLTQPVTDADKAEAARDRECPVCGDTAGWCTWQNNGLCSEWAERNTRGDRFDQCGCDLCTY